MYGGLETARQGTKIVPATDVYNMKLSSSKSHSQEAQVQTRPQESKILGRNRQIQFK